MKRRIVDDRTRALRLLALSKRGESGEREAARLALDRLLERTGITLKEISSESVELYWYAFMNESEERLLSQIASVVVDNSRFRIYGDRRNRMKSGFDLTESQAAELDYLYAHYRRLLRKEMAVFIAAFIQRNNIFASSALRAGERQEPLTREQAAEMRRVLAISGLIERDAPRKAIGGAS